MRRGLVFALLACTAATAVAQQVRTDGRNYVGAVGCKSSSCHGGVGPKNGQYLTWLERDIHTRGYAILTNARSERIADALDLAPSQTGGPRAAASGRCTICHSPFHAIPPTRRAAAAEASESVSCEHCHGAAGTWLRGHTRADWTYATRIGAGMRDLKSFYVRANTCVACHQNLDSDIVAAGHPELTFELDGQSVAQPKHWSDPPGSGPRAWLVGQAVALRELSWRLATTGAKDPATLTQWRALAWLLGQVSGADTASAPIVEDFAGMQKEADALARRAAAQQFSDAFTLDLLRRLSRLGPAFTENADVPRDLLFRRAHRLVLALERLAVATQRTPPELQQLRADLASEPAFESAQFAEHLNALRDALQ